MKRSVKQDLLESKADIKVTFADDHVRFRAENVRDGSSLIEETEAGAAANLARLQFGPEARVESLGHSLYHVTFDQGPRAPAGQVTTAPSPAPARAAGAEVGLSGGYTLGRFADGGAA